LTWREYYFIKEGYWQREEIKWEHTRLIGCLIYNANAKKGSQKSVTDFMPLRRDEVRKQYLAKKALRNKQLAKNGKT